MKRFYSGFLGIFLMLVFLTACDSGRRDRNFVVEQEKMVDVMVDVHLTEAILRNKKISGEELDKKTSDYYSRIFHKHDITKKQFDSSLVYYEKNVDQFNEIYEEVIVKLNKKQRKAEQARKKKLKEKGKEPQSDSVMHSPRR